jgi:hypothetical protein
MRRRIRRRARTTVSPPVIFDPFGSAFQLLVGTPVGPHAGRLVGRWRRVEEPDRAQDAVSVALDGSSNQTWVVSIDSEPWCRAAEFGRPYRLDKTAARRERTPRQPRLEPRWPCHTDVREGIFRTPGSSGAHTSCSAHSRSPGRGLVTAGAGDALGRTSSATCRTEPLRVGAQRVLGCPRRTVGRRGRLAASGGPRHHLVTRGGSQTSSMRVALTAAARTRGRRPAPPTRSTPPSRSATLRSPVRS